MRYNSLLFNREFLEKNLYFFNNIEFMFLVTNIVMDCIRFAYNNLPEKVIVFFR